jgi:cellulose synthase/poly-beta-1,6-N-acetylglucosamine synthase-like glycosyltransferase
MSVQIIKKEAIKKYEFIFAYPLIYKLYIVVSFGFTFFSYYYFITYLIQRKDWGLFFLPFLLVNILFFLSSVIIKNLKNKSSVDIFLPICGENIEIVKKTWNAVKSLDYGNYNVYVLDDKGDKEYHLLALQMGFNYLSRPNKGYLKKAGNLKYAFNNTRGDYIVIFDADFVPKKEFLKEALPYIVEDPTIGILQTPQYFDCNEGMEKKNFLEYGAGQIQEEFYKVVQVARGKIGGSICVGSNAIYSRKALDTIGGTYEIEHSEDVWTGLALNMKGFKVQYLPIVLATGNSPENLDQFIRQQYRWCQGTLTIATSKEFWKSKIGFGTRFSFVSGFLFYLTTLSYFVLPFSIFYLVYTNPESLSLKNSIIAVPSLVLLFLSYRFMNIQKTTYGSLFTRFYANASYVLSVLHGTLGLSIGWTPTGKKSKINFWVILTVSILNVYTFVYTALTISIYYFKLIELSNIDHIIVNGWLVVTNVLNLSFAYFGIVDLLNKRVKRIEITKKIQERKRVDIVSNNQLSL